MTQRRPAALCAAALLTLGTVWGAAPAFAEGPTSSDLDPTAAAAAAAATLTATSTTPDAALGYGVTTDGTSIVLVNEALRDAPGTAELLESLDVEDIAFVDAPVADTATDVVGGAGYLSGQNGNFDALCSVGFTAWSPTGDPALLSAGHCTSDGALTEVTLSQPSDDAAHAGNNDATGPNGTGLTGHFGFSQYGGPGNTLGAENAPDSTDISVIDIANGSLTLHPAVTDWSTAADNDLAAAATPVKGLADPVSGTIAKSGRTTGLTSGNTTVELLYTDGQLRPTEILDGYMQVSGRWVHGFLGGATSNPGDSGGAVFQGDQAVGIVSGSPSTVTAGDDWAWYTRLADALEYTGGYTVSLDIDAPTVTTPAAGESIPAGGDIVVAVPSNAAELSVSAPGLETRVFPNDGGEVQFSAPDTPGDVTYSLVATNGYSSSATTTAALTVALPAPTLDDQEVAADEGARTADARVSGTGAPDATVAVTGLPGDAARTARVAADGTWSLVAHGVDIGRHTISASQELDGATSGTSTATLTVTPAAPQITSITPDDRFTVGQAPRTVAGTGLPGAVITATLGDASANSGDAAIRVGADGTWQAPLSGLDAPAGYTLTAAQTVNGVNSPSAAVTFAVVATGAGSGGSGSGTDDTGLSPEDPTVAGLSETGGSTVLPFAVLGVIAVLLGTAAAVAGARRRAHRNGAAAGV